MSDEPLSGLAKSDKSKNVACKPFTGFERNQFDKAPPSGDFAWEPLYEDSQIAKDKEAATRAREEERERKEAQDREHQAILIVACEQAEKTVENARDQADKMLEDARDEAEKIVEAARRTSEEIEATAYHAGFDNGEAAGRQLAEQKLEPVVRSLRAAVENLSKQQDALVHAAEEQTVEIAFMAAAEIAHREIRLDPSVALDIVRAAISRVQRAAHLTVYVSPHDFRYLEEHLDLLQAMTDNGVKVSLEPDAAVARGGCRVVGNTGEIDATIHSMLKHLSERLWEQE